MLTDSEVSEARKLLASSNRNALDFVKRDVELCLTFLELAEVELSIGEKETSVRSWLDARKACGAAKRFLPRVTSRDSREHDALYKRIDQLQARIEDFSRRAHLPNPSEEKTNPPGVPGLYKPR